MATTEAVLILPLRDNDGAKLASVHAALGADLLSAFGGFTFASVRGCWRDESTGRVYRDESTEYRIAADWTPALTSTLTNLARRYARLARQEAVYVRDGFGAVAFAAPEEAPRVFGCGTGRAGRPAGLLDRARAALAARPARPQPLAPGGSPAKAERERLARLARRIGAA